MTAPIGRALRGAVCGLGATLAMSGVMLATQRAIGKQPPQRIVETGMEAAGVPDPDRVEPATSTLAAAAHLGYGTLLGALLEHHGPALDEPSRPQPPDRLPRMLDHSTLRSSVAAR